MTLKGQIPCIAAETAGPDRTLLHPALRILGVVLFIACLSTAKWSVLLAGIAFVAYGLLSLGRLAWLEFYRMSRGMLLFYLSIIIVFGWFTPGELLWPALGETFSPTEAGLLLGLQRTLVLILCIGAVVWLLRASSQTELIHGLLWLSSPLRPLGFPAVTFALRLTLTLRMVPKVRRLVTRMIKKKGYDLTQRAAMLMHIILRLAAKTPVQYVTITPLPPPSAMEWIKLCGIITPIIWLCLS